jgi:hypothetical protein
MKAITLTLLAVAMVLVAGCLVTSIYPFYNEKDVVYEPALAAHWTRADDAKEHWLFEKGGTNSYQLTYMTGDQTNIIQAHLFKLDGQMFLDLFGGEKEWTTLPPPIPSHFLLRVSELTPKVRLAPLNNEWLAKWVEKNPQAVKYELVKIGDKADDVRVVLTGATPELQRFIRGHLKYAEAWSETFDLNRD